MYIGAWSRCSYSCSELQKALLALLPSFCAWLLHLALAVYPSHSPLQQLVLSTTPRDSSGVSIERKREISRKNELKLTIATKIIAYERIRQQQSYKYTQLSSCWVVYLKKKLPKRPLWKRKRKPSEKLGYVLIYIYICVCVCVLAHS